MIKQNIKVWLEEYGEEVRKPEELNGFREKIENALKIEFGKTSICKAVILNLGSINQIKAHSHYLYEIYLDENFANVTNRIEECISKADIPLNVYSVELAKK